MNVGAPQSRNAAENRIDCRSDTRLVSQSSLISLLIITYPAFYLHCDDHRPPAGQALAMILCQPMILPSHKLQNSIALHLRTACFRQVHNSQSPQVRERGSCTRYTISTRVGITFDVDHLGCVGLVAGEEREDMREGAKG